MGPAAPAWPVVHVAHISTCRILTAASVSTFHQLATDCGGGSAGQAHHRDVPRRALNSGCGGEAAACSTAIPDSSLAGDTEVEPWICSATAILSAFILTPVQHRNTLIFTPVQHKRVPAFCVNRARLLHLIHDDLLPLASEHVLCLPAAGSAVAAGRLRLQVPLQAAACAPPPRWPAAAG